MANTREMFCPVCNCTTTFYNYEFGEWECDDCGFNPNDDDYEDEEFDEDDDDYEMDDDFEEEYAFENEENYDEDDE